MGVLIPFPYHFWLPVRERIHTSPQCILKLPVLDLFYNLSLYICIIPSQFSHGGILTAFYPHNWSIQAA